MKFESGETNIICSDIENSLKFYRDILGFEVIEYEEGAVRMKCGKNIFLLLPFAKPSTRKSSYSSVPEISFDLYVNDIKETVKYFEDCNVNLLQTLSDKGAWIVISDPDGLAIEVIQK